MKILGIETSCDETAISIVDASGTIKSPSFRVLSAVVHSQANLHAKWQGVVPNLAKREHAKNLVPVLRKALEESALILSKVEPSINKGLKARVVKILEREPGLSESFFNFVPTIDVPDIDAIAVTHGPGLEPALWTGINFAKALSVFWDKEIIPVNHMEGHTLSALLPEGTTNVKTKTKVPLPAIALLISGGHTELVLLKDMLHYKVIGRTRDDAVGEAFDKVARMLGLPYPGGPHISKMAERFTGPPLRADLPAGASKKNIKFPRPMINSGDLDFSFSGLKTSVLYKIKGLGELSEEIKNEIANEFEEAVVEVLVSKTKSAIERFGAKSIIIGGGVIANKKIRLNFQKMVADKFPDIKLFIPHHSLCGDNATMIALAGYIRILGHKIKKTKPKKNFKAEGNLTLK